MLKYTIESDNWSDFIEARKTQFQPLQNGEGLRMDYTIGHFATYQVWCIWTTPKLTEDYGQ